MNKAVSDALLQQAGIGGDPIANANALIEQGQIDSAQALLETVLRRTPNDPQAWFRLGQIHAHKGDFKPAAQAFKRVISIAPHVEDGYVLLGNTYLRHDRANQALQTYRDGLRNNPNSPLLHFNTGIALKASGDLAQAIESFQTAITFRPEYAQAYFSLGNAYREAELFDEAENAYRQAIALQPDNADYRANLGAHFAAQKNYAAAAEECLAVLQTAPQHIHALRNLSLSLYHLSAYAEGVEVTFRALAVAPNDTMLHYHMGEMLYGLVREGKSDIARGHAETWLKLFPDHAVAQHMTAAVLGGTVPARAGDDYVRETFDRFSGDFEATLGKLGYRVPEMICGLITEALNGRSNVAVLDAGCGTGLCAPLLRPLASSLVGVDLSGGMLEKARDRKLYDALHQAELGAFLAGDKSSYDVTVAADVFCYFGDLAPSFEAIAAHSQPQGLLAFTVEAATEPAPQGYRLGPTGRYQHDAGYVRRVLEQAGFGILRFDDTHGREEMGQPVPCYMVLARLP